MTEGSPQGKPTQSTNKYKEKHTMSGPIAQEKQKKRVHLKQIKEIITILLVMTHFLPRERDKEMMTVFMGSFEK